MALTKNEKFKLDDFMCRHINEYLTTKNVPISTIHSDMENDDVIFSTPLKLVSLQASGKRVDENISIKRDGNILVFVKGAFLKFNGLSYEYGKVVKEKNIFHLTGYTGLQYDILTKEFNININNCKDFYRHYGSFENMVNNYEWIFNYQNDIHEIKSIIEMCENFGCDTMPKGLATELSGNTLTADFLRKYLLRNYSGKYYNISESMCHYTSENSIPEFIKTISWINENIPFESFMKMVKNEIVSESYRSNLVINGNIETFFESVRHMLKKWDDKEPFKFNFERGLTYNCDAMNDYTDKEKNKELATKLQAFNFINNLKINDDKYIVVVPQTQSDKREEGRQQNNCVGSYYDDYIMSGHGTVYFIRKANNKNHSFITCRYDYRDNRTVEARYVNNNSIEDEDKEIIDNLDKIIRKKLNEKRKEEN